MAPLIKNPYDFYKVLTFEGEYFIKIQMHMAKLEPKWIISLQITVI